MSESLLELETRVAELVGETTPTDFLDWITANEAAELTGYHRNAFISATKRGALKSIMRGHTRFFLRRDVLAYVEEMKDLGTQRFTPKRFREE